MKTVGLVPNLEKEDALEVTSELIDFLINKGCKAAVSENVAKQLGKEKQATSEAELYLNSDFIIALGGDGTLLGAARKAAVNNVPLLGINFGTLGYLTDVKKNDAHKSIERVLQGDYYLETRIIIEANVNCQSEAHETHIALNDVCITRGVFSKMIEFNVYINKEYQDTYRADGLIIATPTGSTAYNLSAGGPILKPDVECVVITPICPHSLHARSIVISAMDVVTVEVSSNSKGDTIAVMDGQTAVAINRNDVIHIRRSKYNTRIIKTNNLGFYDILRQKLV